MSGTDSPTLWCPNCGAEYRPGFSVCSDCAVALVGERPPPLPGPEAVDHEMVRFDLSSWSDEDRRALSLLLSGEDVPHQWNAGVLEAPRVRQRDIERLVGEITPETGQAPPQVVRAPLWAFGRVVDWVGGALALAVVAEAAGGATDGARIASMDSGGLGSSIFSTVKLGLEFATPWAGPPAGLTLLIGVGVVVLPRTLARFGLAPVVPPFHESSRGRWALRLLLLASGLAALAQLTGIVAYAWIAGSAPSFPSGIAATSISALVAGLIPTLISAIAAAHQLRQSLRSGVGDPDDTEPPLEDPFG